MSFEPDERYQTWPNGKPPNWASIKPWTIDDAVSKQDIAVFKVLEAAWEDWDNGIEWRPFKIFKWEARPKWELKYYRDKLISFIDSEFTWELKEHSGYWNGRGHDIHPMFFQFSDEHVLAMCQRLDWVIAHPVEGPAWSQDIRNALREARQREEEGWMMC